MLQTENDGRKYLECQDGCVDGIFQFEIIVIPGEENGKWSLIEN